MSEGEKRPHYLAWSVADQIVSSLTDCCQRIEIAGSLRRKCETVGDIEIVAIPIVDKPITLWGEVTNDRYYFNHLLNRLDHLLAQGKIGQAKDSVGRVRWGNKLRALSIRTKRGEMYKVDLFLCEENNWGNIFLIRTGSREFSQWMVTQQQAGGAMPPDMQHDGGWLWKYNQEYRQRLTLKEEKDWFDAVGLPVIPPEYRHDNLWHQWLEENHEKT